MQRMVVVPLLLKAEIESESIIALFAGPALSWIDIWLLCHGTLYLVPVIPLSVWEGLVGWLVGGWSVECLSACYCIWSSCFLRPC